MSKTLNEQAADLLEAAGAVLWLPEWWTKRVSAKDARGREVGLSAFSACRFCAAGALWAGNPDFNLRQRAAAALKSVVGGSHIEFNDHAKSSKEVATAMFLAADKLRGES